MKFPAEWSRHRACWLAYPCDEHLWEDSLPAAQAEFISLIDLIGRSEQVEVLCANESAEASLLLKVATHKIRAHQIAYWDIWLRDTGPIFLTHKDQMTALQFNFNGWGGKYPSEEDPLVASRIAETRGVSLQRSPLVCEGGALETNGEGLLITTEDCLLNDNRNPKRFRREIENSLKEALGVVSVYWIKKGLLNDHTDGHVDTLARFVNPSTLLCMEPLGKSDPNYEVLSEIMDELRRIPGINLKTIPGPGEITDTSGQILPASYMNFYISNEHVIVPTYGSSQDKQAVEEISRYFPERHVVGLSAKAILSGGGAFHCITQQEPEVG